ncbi:MAG: hypothetical protein K8F91_22890 [Candidatus Obscuribacterales bacterium]|nr:hypothetical protein [Candidatus Obscuribacterales bacterium]
MLEADIAARAAKSKARIVQYIKNVQDDNGFWPYKRNQGPSAEATSWCAMALAADREAIRKATTFLIKSQEKNGGWSTAPDTGFSDWASGPTLLCLRYLNKISPEARQVKGIVGTLEKGLLHLIDSRVEFFPVVARLLMLMGGGEKNLYYARGWPWDPDCYHWVEPTSYYLMALKIPGMPRPDLYIKIVEFANQFLLENACVGGGWNHGNHISLGAKLPPYRMTTAEALLALQDIPKSKQVKAGLDILASYSNQDSSALSLSLSILALRAYEKKNDSELAFLLSRQRSDGSFSDNNMVNGLACLALSAENSMRAVLSDSPGNKP